MATQILRDATIYWNEVAVTDISNSVSVEMGLEPQDCTTWGATARKYAAGLFTGSVTADGFADFTGYDGSLDSIFRNRTNARVTVTSDSADASVAYFFTAIHNEMSPLSGTVGEMAAVSVTASVRGQYGPIRGQIMVPLAARGGSSSGTAYQLGAVSATQRVFGHLHVTAASGSSPTLDVTLRSDDNQGFSSPTTRLTFSQQTTTGSSSQDAGGAITDDWWRVTWTIGGGSPSFTFVVVAGIATV